MRGVKGGGAQKALVILAIALGAAILAGTGIALFGRVAPRDQTGSGTAAPVPLGSAIFEGLGDFRIKAADGAMLALKVGLEYPASERELGEELLAKRDAFREKIVGYLSAKKRADLDPIAMDAVKASVQDLLDADLVTGRLSAVIFSDYGFIE